MIQDSIINLVREICHADFIHPTDKVNIIKLILGGGEEK